MALTNGGTTLLATAAVGGSFNPYNATFAYLGVGDGTGAFVKTQTGLLGTNKAYQAQDTGWPTQGGTGNTTLTYQSTFGPSVANFAWEEIALFNASAGGGTMLNRFLQSLGTKASGQSWSLQVTLVVSNP
jgi:hypothetical protein